MEIRALVTVIVFGMACLVPLIAILTRHQRAMAQLLRGNGQVPDTRALANSDSVHRELAELKSLMHQQALAIDNLSNKVSATAELNQGLESAGR